MNYQELLVDASKQLKFNKLNSAKLDAELILSKILGLSREKILLNLNEKINDKVLEKFNWYLKLRKQNRPIAYILGFKDFWKYKFKVDKNVLIPRPETELIIEQALKNLPKLSTKNILDIGTGSGCIIISIIKERENCKATAIDKSLKALKVAKSNAEMHHVQKKIKFLNIDVDKYFANKYDLIVSNPPYIKDIEILSLDKDVKLNEPKLALSGGISGLNKVFKVINKSQKLLKTKGKLILEIGDKQSKEVKKYLIKNNFNQIQVFKDLSRKDRCIVSTKAN
ncbi:peptide chain release factor N(5)-glutamine methyltransferase [Candidatus Pelagibacter sp. RS40]|uniref:peptide chain release factor N(5)-glutamine methyltransferase n=1 Tax=Candidatus Pelagibacter sp. RS40 TaxID=1977865 RepID=UPI000A14C2F6|nr:peptide chain release factor N(5)-glutamine methyltransferase [Candidatus Pelagibacter sp. RS40]ARJ49221.1 protein-(glutamine-N5) methyltransferase, release factor-specific [Candidatus Pelagibacter sp. RS40]